MKAMLRNLRVAGLALVVGQIVWGWAALTHAEDLAVRQISLVLCHQVQEGLDLIDDLPEVRADVVPPANVIGVENFDMWVFGAGSGINGQMTAAMAERQLRDRSRKRVQWVDQACGLTAAQKQKLELAARGDTIHLLDRIETVRQKFMELRHDQNRMGEIWREIQPLQVAWNKEKIHGGALFQKSIRRTLNEQQWLKFEQMDLDRRRFHFRSASARMLADLQNTLPLTQRQRDDLLRLMNEEKRLPTLTGQYDQQVVLYQMSQIPAAKLEQVVDPIQWRVLQSKLSEIRNLRQWLESQGMLELDEEAPYGGKP